MTRKVKTPDGEIEVERFAVLGPFAHIFIAELARQTADGQPADVGALVDGLAGVMSERSVREYARRAVFLELGTSTRAEATGPGRRALLYKLTDSTAAAWAVVEERGRAALRMALAAAARRKAEARAVFQTVKRSEGRAGLPAAWAAFRARMSEQTERGRLDLGRAAWVEGVKRMKGRAIEEVKRKAALGVLADDRPDPVIMAALQLGGVPVGLVPA